MQAKTLSALATKLQCRPTTFFDPRRLGRVLASGRASSSRRGRSGARTARGVLARSRRARTRATARRTATSRRTRARTTARVTLGGNAHVAATELRVVQLLDSILHVVLGLELSDAVHSRPKPELAIATIQTKENTIMNVRRAISLDVAVRDLAARAEEVLNVAPVHVARQVSHTHTVVSALGRVAT